MSHGWVVDTSVLIKGFIVEADSARVHTLLSRLKDNPPSPIHLPEVGIMECVNVLWKQVRFQGTPIEEAEQALRDLIDLPLTLHRVSALLPRALQIGIQYQHPVYDTIYITLAESLSIPPNHG